MSLSLRSLSDQELLSGIQDLNRRERSLTLRVLLHLNEIEHRKLHLKLGFATMFVYCTARLGYSPTTAFRRIRTARCIARFPEVYRLLESHEVNVSTVSQVSEILNEKNHAEVLARIRGKSQREVEAIVAEYDPQAARPRDRVRTVVMRVPLTASGGAAGVTLPGTVLPADAPAVHAAGRKNDSASIDPAAPSECKNTVPSHFRNGSASVHVNNKEGGAVGFETLHVIRFAARPAFMRKLERVKSLASHRLPPNASMEQVFELVLDAFLENQDPAKRQERRERRIEKERVVAERQAPRPQRQHSGDRRRNIPAPVRDAVFARDRSRCTYVSPTGQRCESRHHLQVDHVIPVARGGSNTPDLGAAPGSDRDSRRGPPGRRGDVGVARARHESKTPVRASQSPGSRTPDGTCRGTT